MDWLGDQAWVSWLALGGLLLVGEIFSLDLVMMMLAVGCVGGVVAALLGAPFLAQAIVAAVLSVACLGVLRPGLVKRLHGGPDLVQGHQKLIGAQGTVVAEVSALNPGRARISGEEWTTQPYDETETIPVGSVVEVLQIRGATAYVIPVATLPPATPPRQENP